MEKITVEVPDGMVIDKITFKKKVVLPKTWKEAYDSMSDTLRSIIINMTIYCPEDYLNLKKLQILRDIYRQGWKPDFIDASFPKFQITVVKNKITTSWSYTLNSFLAFQSEDIRDEFLDNFRDLIEECKDFI